MFELKPIYYDNMGFTCDYYIINKYKVNNYIYPNTNKKLYWIKEYYENPIFKEVTWNEIRNSKELNNINHIIEIDSNMNYFYVCDKIISFCSHIINDYSNDNELNQCNFLLNDCVNFNKVIKYDVQQNIIINL